MDSLDVETLNFYAAEAETYSLRARGAKSKRLDPFLAALPVGAKILELGCGGGQDSLVNAGARFRRHADRRFAGNGHVRPNNCWGDRSPFLPSIRLDEDGIYDGVWANACLLHVPRPELCRGAVAHSSRSRHRRRLLRQLQSGLGEGRDRFQRYYNYPSRDWLIVAICALGWMSIEIDEDIGGGYDGENTEWLHVTAVRAA